jgi:hypothetical protein
VAVVQFHQGVPDQVAEEVDVWRGKVSGQAKSSSFPTESVW